ncbi:DsbA family protein [soil metagenome]
MSKQFWAVVAGIVIVLVGIFMLTGNKSDSGQSSSNSGATTNHVEGKGSTGVKLVEYGDFQCPYCQTYHATVKQIVAEYDEQITFQFVNFPLTSIHQNAFAASRAAEAAGKQNKYWEMHDALYENNDPNGASGWVASTSPTTYFNQFATQIGLNVAQFKKDYASSAVNDSINADMSAGTKLGIEGTPTFYLDGKKVTIANTAADFKKVLDAAIKKKAGSTTPAPAAE